MKRPLGKTTHEFVKRCVRSRTEADLNLSQVFDITARTGGMYVSPFAVLREAASLTPPDHI